MDQHITQQFGCGQLQVQQQQQQQQQQTCVGVWRRAGLCWDTSGCAWTRQGRRTPQRPVGAQNLATRHSSERRDRPKRETFARQQSFLSRSFAYDGKTARKNRGKIADVFGVAQIRGTTSSRRRMHFNFVQDCVTYTVSALPPNQKKYGGYSPRR